MAQLRITLIHGTFGRKAKWVRPDAKLQTTIERAFGRRIVFEKPLYWTGRNLMSDRLHASDDLAQRLSACRAKHPKDKFVLIGHSHGGSVAAYCLRRNPNLRGSIAGVAFLATPFIEIRPRPGWEQDVRALWIGLGAMFWLVVAIGACTLFARSDLSDTLGVAVLLPLVALGLGVFRAVPRVSSRAIQVIDRRQSNLSADRATGTLPRGPRYLFARAPGDEAAGILSIAQMLVWPFGRVMAICSLLFGRGATLARRVWTSSCRGRLLIVVAATMFMMGLMGNILATTIGFGLTGQPDPTIWDILSDLLSYPYRDIPWGIQGPPWFEWASLFEWLIDKVVRGAMVLAHGFFGFIALLYGLWFVATALVALSCFAFGASFWYAGPFVEMAVEPLPLGHWTLHRLSWPQVEVSPLRLSHSEVYLTSEALDTLVTWLSEVCKRNRIC